MAGASMDMRVDSVEFRNAMERLFIKTADLRDPHDEIGSSLLTSTQQRFEDEESPEGKRWAALALSTQLRRIGRGRKSAARGGEHILRNKGLLVASVTYLATPTELTIGSNRKQAALLQLGGTDDMAPGPAAVPARPYLGMSAADARKATQILLDHLGGAVQ